MANKPMPWIKQYPTRLHDVRLCQLHERQQLRYYQLNLLAGLLNADGSFVQGDHQLKMTEIAFLIHVKDHKQLEKDISALKKAGLIKANGHGPYIAGFKDEQIQWLEKQRGERERKRRERHARVTRDIPVTTSGVTPLEQEQEQDKTLVVVVIADALNLYQEKIGELTPHIRKELEKLFKANPKVLEQSINAAADHDKHTLAYIKGAFKNIIRGTEKPEPRNYKPKAQKPKLPDNGVILS